MRTLLIVIIFCVLGFHLRAQIKNDKIVNAIEKNGYFFIPKTAFETSTEAVIYNIYPPDKKIKNKKQFEFYWHSVCNDGSYNLTITPEQIIFSSGHDNPNPNFLFWVLSINEAQYAQISKSLKKRVPAGLRDLSDLYPDKYVFYDGKYKEGIKIPDKWTKAKEAEFKNSCELAKRKQIEKFFQLLNTTIIHKEDKLLLPTPSELKYFSPKYYAYSLQILEDWMPTVIKK